MLVDLCNAAVGQDHGVLDDLLRSESVPLTRAHRIDSQSLKKPGSPDGKRLAVDQGVVLRRNGLQDSIEIGAGAESGLVVVHQFDVVDVSDLKQQSFKKSFLNCFKIKGRQQWENKYSYFMFGFGFVTFQK